jgi:hypothetical protein
MLSYLNNLFFGDIEESWCEKARHQKYLLCQQIETSKIRLKPREGCSRIDSIRPRQIKVVHFNTPVDSPLTPE